MYLVLALHIICKRVKYKMAKYVVAKFWFAKQHKLETFDHDIKVVLGVYCLLSRHAYKNMFNLKPLVCLVTEPPGVSCVSAGDRELSPAPLLASVPQ